MTLYIGQQHPITVYMTVFWVSVDLVLSVIRCSFYYFLDRILFHHDFHEFSPDDLCSRPEAVLIYIYIIYIYIHYLYEFCHRTYIYIQQECHSVLVKLHPITFYRTFSGGCAVPGLNATFCFLWFTNCVLLSDK